MVYLSRFLIKIKPNVAKYIIHGWYGGRWSSWHFVPLDFTFTFAAGHAVFFCVFSMCRTFLTCWMPADLNKSLSLANLREYLNAKSRLKVYWEILCLPTERYICWRWLKILLKDPLIWLWVHRTVWRWMDDGFEGETWNVSSTFTLILWWRQPMDAFYLCHVRWRMMERHNMTHETRICMYIYFRNVSMFEPM